MSSSDTARGAGQLRVLAESAAEIEVVDSSAAVVAQGSGIVEVSLPSGIYQVRASTSAGLQTPLAVVAQDETTEVLIRPGEPIAPVGLSVSEDQLPTSTMVDEIATGAASGEGGVLYVMVRSVDASAAVVPDGVSVWRPGSARAVLQRSDWRSTATAAATAVAVPAGWSVVESTGAPALARSVYVWPGRTTGLFALSVKGTVNWFDATVHSWPTGEPWSRQPGMLDAELAMAALRTGRLVADDASASGDPYQVLLGGLTAAMTGRRTAPPSIDRSLRDQCAETADWWLLFDHGFDRDHDHGDVKWRPLSTAPVFSLCIDLALERDRRRGDAFAPRSVVGTIATHALRGSIWACWPPSIDADPPPPSPPMDADVTFGPPVPSRREPLPRQLEKYLSTVAEIEFGGSLQETAASLDAKDVSAAAHVPLSVAEAGLEWARRSERPSPEWL